MHCWRRGRGGRSPAGTVTVTVTVTAAAVLTPPPLLLLLLLHRVGRVQEVTRPLQRGAEVALLSGREGLWTGGRDELFFFCLCFLYFFFLLIF